MKRKDNLFPVVCDEETIRKAIHKAALGKRKRKIVVQILENEDYYVQQIKEMLINKTYAPNDFKQDIIFDGIRHKERVISKPCFYPDQIIHWCVYLAMKPWIYPSMYEYSCGSIPGRGIHYGKRHVARWIYGDKKGTKYYLQMDIHKFYPLFHFYRPKIIRQCYFCFMYQIVLIIFCHRVKYFKFFCF